MQNTRVKINLMVTCNASGRWGEKNLIGKNFLTCFQQQLNMSCKTHVSLSRRKCTAFIFKNNAGAEEIPCLSYISI